MRTEYNTALQAGMRRTLGSVNGSQQDNNNSPPPNFVPQPPVAPSPQPRVAHPSSSPHPSPSSPPLQLQRNSLQQPAIKL